jgi:hypothetical protein
MNEEQTEKVIDNLPASPLEIVALGAQFSPEEVSTALEVQQTTVQKAEARVVQEEKKCEGYQSEQGCLSRFVQTLVKSVGVENRALLENFAHGKEADLESVATTYTKNEGKLRAANEALRLIASEILPVQAVAVAQAKTDCAQAHIPLAKLGLLAAGIEYNILMRPVVEAQGGIESGLTPKIEYFSQRLFQTIRLARIAEQNLIDETAKLDSLRRESASRIII